MYKFGNQGGDSYRGGGALPPVKLGEELTVKIEAVGEKGDGIAKKDGFVIFVPGVKEGQEVKIRITKVLRKVGFAEVVTEGEAAPSEEAPSEEEAPAEAPEEKTEDSETFGEEPAEKSDDSETFGEEAEEKPEQE